MKETVKNLTLILFSLIVSIGFAEVICRIIPLSNDSDPTYKLSHEVLPFVMKPNSESISIHGNLIKINSHGLRDYDYQYKKNNGTFRILALGDSSTFAYGNKMEDGYTKVLERSLNAFPNKKYEKIEVINSGHPGFNTRDEYNYLRLYGLKYLPDLIVVGVMSNDISDSLKLVIKDGVDSSPGSYWLKLNIPTWVKRILRQSHLYIAIGWIRVNMAFSIRQKYNILTREKEINNKLDKFEEHIDSLIKLAQEYKIPVCFIFIPNRRETISKKYQFPLLFIKIRQKEMPGVVDFIDMLSFYKNFSDHTDDIYAIKDGAHPNAKGHRILADHLNQKLKNHINIEL